MWLQYIESRRGLGTRYRSLVCAIMWVGPTARPDVLYPIGICARAFTFPTVDLYGCAVRVLVYLACTLTLGITYSAYNVNPTTLDCASDSDWSVRRSTSGGGMRLAGGSVHAASRKQECTSGSSSHAELIAASALSDDVQHAVPLLSDMNAPQTLPIIMDVDNKGVYDISRNFSATKNLRHLDRRAFRLRERCFSGLIEARLVKTTDNWADLFTKALDPKPFLKFRSAIMNTVDALVSRVSQAIQGLVFSVFDTG